MTKMRRFAAIAAAAAMTACMAMPMTSAFAASGDSTITISGWNTTNHNDQGTHTLEAYQIFEGNLDTATGKILTDIEFGDGVKSAELLTALSTASSTEGHALNGKFPAKADGSAYTASEIAAIISAFGNDAAETKAFADIVGGCLTEVKSGSFNPATEGASATISGLAVGYYLIQDASGSPVDNDTVNAGAKTRFILSLTEANAEVEIKSSAPSVMKKVYEDTNSSTAAATIGGLTESDTKWNDVADYDIGEAVPFKLYGTMPSTLADYNSYYYCFNDTLGTQFDMPTDVTVTVGTSTLKYSELTNGTDGNCRIVIDSATHKITVSFEDIKKYGVTTDSIVTVEYNAVLNSTAAIGQPGQQNEVYLDYSSNPNEDYAPNTDSTDTEVDKPDDIGDTPVDKVIVFTYELDVTKVDKDNTAKKLEGAEFVLQRGENEYAKITDGLISWVASKTDATTLTSDASGMFKVTGLDEGTYTLIETKAPDGYSLPSSGFAVNLVANTANNQTWAFDPATALTELTLNGEAQDTTDDTKFGTAALTVENSSGKTLPSTGGIGTTIFYVVGGTLVAGAGVTLIAKKRMKKED